MSLARDTHAWAGAPAPTAERAGRPRAAGTVRPGSALGGVAVTHLVLGLLLMLVGAGLMAVGLYVRALGGARRAATAGTARPVSPRRRIATIVSSAIFLLLGLALVVVGIVVSLEPQTTAPR